MYIEILLVGVIVFFLLIYTGAISTSKFFGENKGIFELLQEKDYEFLLRAKYGERVYDVGQVFRKRVFKGLIAMIAFIFLFLSGTDPSAYQWALPDRVCNDDVGFCRYPQPFHQLHIKCSSLRFNRCV